MVHLIFKHYDAHILAAIVEYDIHNIGVAWIYNAVSFTDKAFFLLSCAATAFGADFEESWVKGLDYCAKNFYVLLVFDEFLNLFS